MIGFAAAADPNDETPALTWQEANKRSAELLEKKETIKEAADMARLAFDLYPLQTKNYNSQNHAQLLLNLVDARRRAVSMTAASTELERGIEVIKARAGPKEPALIDLWRQGSAIYSPERERYFTQAVELASEIWGAGDPRSIKLLLSMSHDRRFEEGFRWASGKLRLARAQALETGVDGDLIDEIDLMLAKIHMEARKYSDAIEGFKPVIARLEGREDRGKDWKLPLAYACLEYSYEKTGDAAAAAEIRQKWSALPAPEVRENGGGLTPVFRVPPRYPLRAAERNISGKVELLVDVNPDGTVADVKILRADPPGYFEKPTLQAVRKWKFRPRIVDGQAVASSGTQLVEYKLVTETR